jgi:ribosomal protein S18 acetylase RimI-like enzyme
LTGTAATETTGPGAMPEPALVTVRPATPDDVPAMARLHARSWPVAYRGLLPDRLIANVVADESARAERWRRRIADHAAPGGVLVAERDGRIVGHVFWAPGEDADATRDTAEVQAIYVDPDATGQGAGRAMLAAATASIEAMGFATITLWVLTANARARRFYEAAGWRPDGRIMVERRPGGTLREMRYRLDLPPRGR